MGREKLNMAHMIVIAVYQTPPNTGALAPVAPFICTGRHPLTAYEPIRLETHEERSCPLIDQSGQRGLLTNSAHPCSALPSEADIAQRDRYVCFDLNSGH